MERSLEAGHLQVLGVEGGSVGGMVVATGAPVDHHGVKLVAEDHRPVCFSSGIINGDFFGGVLRGGLMLGQHRCPWTGPQVRRLGQGRLAGMTNLAADRLAL
jgi:hypothetical protein